MQKKKIILVIAIAALVVVGTTWYLWHRLAAGDGDHIFVSGNIEADDVELSFRIPGWVQDRYVQEGDVVVKGKPVAELDARELTQQRDLAAAQLAEAKSSLERSLATWNDLKAGSRQSEIAEAEAAVARARSDAEFRATDFRRVKELLAYRGATQQEVDLASASLKAANAALLQAQAKLTLVKEGTRPNLVIVAQRAYEQAKAQVDQAKASLDMSQTRLGYARLLSPVGGVVLSDNVEPGEFIMQATPVVTVADLKHVYMRAYINETDLGRVHRGQKVLVTTDTYPDKVYEGRITFLSDESEFTPKNVQTPKERVKLVYRIKVAIDNPNLELKPGMPADGKILLK